MSLHVIIVCVVMLLALILSLSLSPSLSLLLLGFFAGVIVSFGWGGSELSGWCGQVGQELNPGVD